MLNKMYNSDINTFQENHGKSKVIYLVLAIFCMAFALTAFIYHDFISESRIGVKSHWIIHVHAIVYVAWLMLFIVQSYLAVINQIELHKRVGQFLIAYAFFMISMGIAVFAHQFVVMISEGQNEIARHATVAPVMQLILFTIFFSSAVLYRNKPEVHKRLMIVAATSVLYAAVVRLPFLHSLAIYSSYTFRTAIWLLPIFIAMTYDLLDKKTIHPAYFLSFLLIAIFGSTQGIIKDCSLWINVTDYFAKLTLDLL